MKRSDEMQRRGRTVLEAGPGGIHRTPADSDERLDPPAPGSRVSGPGEDDGRETSPGRRQRSGAAAKTVVLAVAGAVAAMVAVIAVVQNSGSVELEFLWWSIDAPLAVLLVAALIAGGLLTAAVAAIVRHRRATSGDRPRRDRRRRSAS